MKYATFLFAFCIAFLLDGVICAPNPETGVLCFVAIIAIITTVKREIEDNEI